MAKNQLGLASLSIEALDEFEHLCNTQHLLEVILSLFDEPDDDKTILKAGLLLDLYRASVDNHLAELRFYLLAIQKLAIGAREDARE